MRGFERLGHLVGNRDRVVERHRPFGEPIGQRLPVDELHYQRAAGGRFFEAVNLGDVGMVERGQHLRFAPEARESIGICGEQIRQQLQRNVAPQLRIAGAIHLAHAAGTERSDNVIRAEACAWRE